MSTLYLTADEQKAYDKILAPLLKEWKGSVEEEKGTAWETEDELKKRIDALVDSGDQKTINLLRHLQVHKDLGGLSADVLPTFLLILGATGISTVMQGLLASAKSPEELNDIATFSQFRNNLLRTNVASPLRS